MLSENRTTGARRAKAYETLVLRGQDLTLDQVDAIANRRCTLRITDEPAVLDRMRLAADLVRQAVADGSRVYGVTTGFGGMSTVPVPAELAAKLQSNLLSSLTTGAGRPVDCRHVRAAMALRANVLLRGASGVRLQIVERFIECLNADAIPVVGDLGSIGASGDLVPLATIARAILGHESPSRVMLGQSTIVDGETALAELGLKPLKLKPKEALAMVNGTSFSAAIGANCAHATRTCLAITLALHAIMLRAMLGYEDPFLPFVHECKPHPGQLWTAELMHQLLGGNSVTANRSEAVNRPHVQDVYSLRCLPQYLGPIVEGIARVIRVVEIEMNSITDNPLIDADEQRFCNSGNFLGQYVGIAMDDLRRFLGLMAKHLDVQIAHLVAPEFNHGLPASLQDNSNGAYNMGLKGLQITGNSIMPLLTYFGNPLVEHFPTHAEQFNQNINGLSWGSANLAARSVELFTHYVSVALLFAVQSLDLRAHEQLGHYDGRALIGPGVVSLYEAVYATLGYQAGEASPLVVHDADQSLERCLQVLSEDIDSQGSIVAAVAPIVESFIKSEVGC